MNYSKTFLILVTIVMNMFMAKGQELDCSVVVNTEQLLNITDLRVFQEMELEFSRFMNGRKWTEDDFREEEKIKCAIVINLEQVSDISKYVASAQIISARPVFETIYESPVLNFADRDFDFEYTQSQPLIFTENTFTTNLTSLLAYYAYMILGYDYATFSDQGGNQMFEKAWRIVTDARQSGYSGWDQFNQSAGNVSRFALADNAVDQQMKSFHETLYQYHRKGLDIMIEEPEEAKVNILESILKLEALRKERPTAIIITSFIDTKVKEMVSIFSEGDLSTRRNAYESLRKIDISKDEEFKGILTN